MKYLIVGGSGYLGAHLIQLLSQDNHDLVVFDNRFPKSNFGKRVTSVIGDITVQGDLNKLGEFGKFDGVFHLAAKKSVPESLVKPELYDEVNRGGTENIVNFCKLIKIRNFVYTSSAAVYGEVDSKKTVKENSKLEPVNPYGTSK